MSVAVSDLWIYPIKSCRGISVKRAEITTTGFENDRLLMLVDSDGRFLTQRTLPAMTLIRPRIAGSTISVNAPGMTELSISLAPGNGDISVVVWRDRLRASDQGDEAADWFSDFLGKKCRLVRMSDRYPRPVDPDYASVKGDRVSFADSFPFLLISEASLEDLNRRMAEPIGMERFRPNIIVSGARPYEEDTWNRIRIGIVPFRVTKPCERCVITTVDPETGKRGADPLRTLATYRLNANNKAVFGQNLIHLHTGHLSTGDLIRVLE